MRAVYFSHQHPAFTKGGAELAAYHLWREIDSRPDHTAWFVGCGSPEVMHIGTTLAAVGDRDYLLKSDAEIMHLSSSTALGPEGDDLAQFLKRIDPDVVHFHHYLNLGVEMFRLVKNTCPRAKIFLTLHEYIAICPNHGQMVKTDRNAGSLCYRSGPRECHQCFPDISDNQFFLRERYIKSFFNLVDCFISPSEFLRTRYVEWGLKPERIQVIENGIPKGEKLPLRHRVPDEIPGRFAYFGQINPYKGVHVILEAFAQLPENIRRQVSLDIYGSAFRNQKTDYQEKIGALVEDLAESVRFHGPYEPGEMERLMQEVDWVVMGSTWWENSPLVILEAFRSGRPVICPDIGGMAEKVEPGIGGFHYRARDSGSLAALICRIADEPGLYDELLGNLPGYTKIGEASRIHLESYQHCLVQRRGNTDTDVIKTTKREEARFAREL